MKFSAGLASFHDKVVSRHTEISRDVAVDVFSKVVGRTPVLTGFARASWRASLNAPDLSVPVRPAENQVLPPPEHGLPSSVEPFSNFFISNGAPHILRLEFGWSDQAPTGMLGVTLEEYRL